MYCCWWNLVILLLLWGAYWCYAITPSPPSSTDGVILMNPTNEPDALVPHDTRSKEIIWSKLLTCLMAALTDSFGFIMTCAQDGVEYRFRLRWRFRTGWGGCGDTDFNICRGKCAVSHCHKAAAGAQIWGRWICGGCKGYVSLTVCLRARGCGFIQRLWWCKLHPLTVLNRGKGPGFLFLELFVCLTSICLGTCTLVISILDHSLASGSQHNGTQHDSNCTADVNTTALVCCCSYSLCNITWKK